MAGLVRGRWSKRYINSFEDKRAYDDVQRVRFTSRSQYALRYLERHGCPSLSAGERAEIERFWSRFGFKVDDFSWWQMYYHVTGLRDPRFIPDDVMGLCVYEYYNDRAYEDAWRDKNLFERLLPEMRFPHTVARAVNGRLITAGEVYGYPGSLRDFSERAFSELDGSSAVVVKDARRTGHGRGVSKHSVHCPGDIEAIVRDRLRYSGNFLIQDAICQHRVLASLNDSSVNVIRLFTWRHDAEVEVLYAAARCGVPGALTDMSHDAEGNELLRVAGLDRSGTFLGPLLDQDGIRVADVDAVKVPGWDEMREMAVRGALQLDNFDLVGWDFAVDNEGEPICLEYNIQWPGTVYYQFSNGPLAGERTEALLHFLEDGDARANYIPYYMSLRE